MKKVMFLIAGLLFSVSASAATLTLTTEGSTNADQNVVVASGNLVEANGVNILAVPNWRSDFNLTTDVDTAAAFEFSFNPESAVSTAQLIVSDSFGNLLNTIETSNFMVTLQLLASEIYFVSFFDVSSGHLIDYNLSVNAVPVPAALLLFAPALLGFFGLRRKAAVAA